MCASADAPRCTVGNLANGTPQYFKVSVVSASGRESALSYPVVATPGETPSTVYEVGVGKPYTSLGAVPWNRLAPGDRVEINGRDLPYREKVLISNSGTATRPIRIVGIPGPTGQFPIIDGQDATTAPQMNYSWAGFGSLTLILIGRRADQPYSYSPQYVSIEGLDIRNASSTCSFTDASGAKTQYATDACGLYLYQAQNITVRGNSIHQNGNGLFTLPVGRNTLIQGNAFYDNGVAGSERQHNTYTEGVGVTYEYNAFGPLRSGALGALLKDRSAGCVVRYNTFQNGGNSGGTRVLDLVEPQEGGPTIYNDPSFHTTFVYGNIIDYKLGGRMIHYGGDQGIYAAYRKGTLYFYNNTVVVRVDRSVGWRTSLFYLDTNDESVDARNNILYFGPQTPGATPTNFSLMTTYGIANLGVNWASAGWASWSDGAIPAGTVNGLANILTGTTANDPGFVNLGQNDLHLATGSPFVDKGVAQATGVPALYHPTLQYHALQAVEPRPIVGPIDLGAFEQAVASTSAQFIKTDTTTQGKWVGVYGKSGFNIIQNVVRYPAFAAVKELTGHGAWSWAASSASPKALQKADVAGDGIAARWYTNAYFGNTISLDIDLTDKQAHALALYFLDWDSANARQLRVDIYDAVTGNLLDTQTVSNFSDGKYGVWNVRGHVRVSITRLAGDGAVLSGLFFD